MLSFADKGPTAIKDVLDPVCDVDDELWVDTDVEQARGGAVSQAVTNVGQKTSHAQLIGYCKGYPKTKDNARTVAVRREI